MPEDPENPPPLCGGLLTAPALFGFAIGNLFPLVMTLPLDVADDAPSVAAFTGVMLGAGYSISATSPFER